MEDNKKQLLEEEKEAQEEAPPPPAAAADPPNSGGGWGGWGFSPLSVFSDLQKAAEEISRNVCSFSLSSYISYMCILPFSLVLLDLGFLNSC